MECWRRIDRASPKDARQLLHACCGSTRWVERMVARRPFHSRDAALAAAREEWLALSRADWLEAFGHHPKIGDVASLRRRFPATHQLSSREQAGVSGAADATLAALADGNRAYVEKFGYIFIVYASGKTADEMLALLRARLAHDADDEIRVAAEEQAKITARRLVGSG